MVQSRIGRRSRTSPNKPTLQSRDWEQRRRMWSVKGLSMEKWLCWSAMGISGFLLLLFLLDIVIQFPFGRLSIVVDIFGLLACGAVLYLGWDASRDLR